MIFRRYYPNALTLMPHEEEPDVVIEKREDVLRIGYIQKMLADDTFQMYWWEGDMFFMEFTDRKGPIGFIRRQ